MPRSLRLRASDNPQMPPPIIATFIPSRPLRYRLQRFDLDLAELDRAGPMLQRDRAFVEHAVAQLGRGLAVEHHGDVAAVYGDFVGIPLAGRFRHRIDLDITGNRAGAVARIGALVEDIGFVTGPVSDLLG